MTSERSPEHQNAPKHEENLSDGSETLAIDVTREYSMSAKFEGDLISINGSKVGETEISIGVFRNLDHFGPFFGGQGPPRST